MVAAVLKWWMWFCRSGDPVEGSALPRRSSGGCVASVLWESSGKGVCGVQNLRLYPGWNAWFLVLGGASHNGMNEA